jgi:hypothetical protein
MKLVKEHINEKFKEDSDPIKDMGIGPQQLIINAAKKLYLYSLEGVNEFIIDEITLYCVGILIKTNYPNWKQANFKKYFAEAFKHIGLDKFLQKEIKPHYHTYHIDFGVDFKDKYDFLFKEDIIINHTNYK